MSITYDVSGSRPEGVPLSTEICSIRTLGAAKAIAVRLRKEGYTVQITPRESGPTAQSHNPFGKAG